MILRILNASSSRCPRCLTIDYMIYFFNGLTQPEYNFSHSTLVTLNFSSSLNTWFLRVLVFSTLFWPLDTLDYQFLQLRHLLSYLKQMLFAGTFTSYLGPNILILKALSCFIWHTCLTVVSASSTLRDSYSNEDIWEISFTRVLYVTSRVVVCLPRMSNFRKKGQ